MLLILLYQALPVAAEGPAVSNQDQPSSVIQWDQPEFPLQREGYASLSWSPIEDAHRYVVRDARHVEVYRGAFPQAFISGLPDGEHAFDVEAFDDTGHRIAATEHPAIVPVQHWPLSQALLLFGLGLIVSIVMAAVIVRGAIGSAQTPLPSDAQGTN